MKVLYEAQDSLEAHMLNNLLLQQGLTTRVDGDYLQGGIGEIQAFGLSRILVNEEDFPAAQAVVSSWEQEARANNSQRLEGQVSRETSNQKGVLFWTMAGSLVAIALLIVSFF